MWTLTGARAGVLKSGPSGTLNMGGAPLTGNAYADDLLLRSAKLVDGGWDGGFSPSQSKETNPIDAGLADFGGGVALVASFSHVVALAGSTGLTLVDTSLAALSGAVRNSLVSWSQDPVDTIIYTHGHVDHVGGAPLFVKANADAGARRPRVVGHANVAPRFQRYDVTEGYNSRINARQFRGRRRLGMDSPNEQARRWGVDWVWPDVSFVDRLALDLGGREAVLFHDKGETDDHAWVWLPERRVICGGDFLTWVFPNAGNPQKVQRYPAEWARAMRAMAALEPELFLPAHGLPIEGRDRIHRVLIDVAEALESLVSQTLELMNSGATLDDVLNAVRLAPRLAERPYLQATYDEPEFVVRNIWRLYGGWWDGDPSHLKPATSAEISTELSSLAGGAQRLAERAAQLSADGQHRLACQLVEIAAKGEPTNASVHALRSEVYRRRRDGELSLMARAIYSEAAERSAAISGAESAVPSDAAVEGAASDGPLRGSASSPAAGDGEL